jgi:hypothetical protein
LTHAMYIRKKYFAAFEIRPDSFDNVSVCLRNKQVKKICLSLCLINCLLDNFSGLTLQAGTCSSANRICHKFAGRRRLIARVEEGLSGRRFADPQEHDLERSHHKLNCPQSPFTIAHLRLRS